MTAPHESYRDDLAAVERMATGEVLALARISRATLWRRVASGRLPAPIDQGRQSLFLRSEVIRALKVETAVPHSIAVATEQQLAAIRRRRRKQS